MAKRTRRGKHQQPVVSEPVWEKPPPRGTEYDWATTEAQLRARPNEWARLFDVIRVSVVNAIRQGGVVRFAPGNGFEVRTTNNRRDAGVRVCTLWMRYVPEKDRSN